MRGISYFADLRVIYSGYFPEYACHCRNLATPAETVLFAGTGAFYRRECGGPTRVIAAPALWRLSPSLRYDFGPAPGTKSWEHAFLCLDGARGERWVREGLAPLLNADGALALRHPDRFRQLFREIHRLTLGGGIGAHRLDELLLAAAEEADAGESAGYGRWRAACELEKQRIAADPGAGHTAAAAAARLRIAPAYFREVFAALENCPYHRFVLRCRLSAAANALRFSDEPLKAIADRLRLGSPTQFNRSFREQYRRTPAAFRRGAEDADFSAGRGN